VSKPQSHGASALANNEITEPTEAKRELSFGSKVGRALEKLLQLNSDEFEELANAPTSIRERFAKRRGELLDVLEPAVKTAVLAAATASEPKAAE
jgi:hypothetical protein